LEVIAGGRHSAGKVATILTRLFPRKELLVSRVPRSQEHLKTGFISEASAAARFRAYARSAEHDGLPNLAKHWMGLATAKDDLAIRQLTAAGQVRAADRGIADALAEDRFENDVLYPKMIRELGGADAADVFREVVAAQEDHIEQLDELRKRLQAASGDID
jgi:rubrerythrin